MVWGIIGLTIVILSMLLFVKLLARFFEFEPLNLTHVLICAGTGFISVFWYEIIKLGKRKWKHHTVTGTKTGRQKALI